MPKIKVYVAGPLNDEAAKYIANLHEMIRVGNLLIKEGYSVYVPGLDFLCGLFAGDWSYEDYFGNSQPWLEVADAILFLKGFSTSKGACREHKRAMELKIPVFYSIDELNGHFRKIQNG